MTPLQKIAMGLVIVVVDADIAGFDGVPDVLGWVLVLLGVRGVAVGARTSLLSLAGLAAAVSLALVRTDTLDPLPESAGWLLSLPQLAFSVVLGGAAAELLTARSPGLARGFRRLRWAFLVAAVGPVLLYGGEVDALLVPLALLTVTANVLLIYLLFRAAGVLSRTADRGGGRPVPDAE